MTSGIMFLLTLAANTRRIASVVGRESRITRDYVTLALLREVEYIAAGIVSSPLGARNPGRSNLGRSVVERWSALDKTRMSKALKAIRTQYLALTLAAGFVVLSDVVESDATDDETATEESGTGIMQHALNLARALDNETDAALIRAALDVVREPIVKAWERTAPAAA